MKKRIFIALLSCWSITSAVSAWENPGLEWSVGADITSAYLYRGMNYGGTSFQPEVSVGYGGLALTAWGNLGAVDNRFIEFTPELDIALSYSLFGLTVGVNHLYYFDGSKYFDFHGNGTTQTEVYAEYDFSEMLENVPLSLGWYTYVAGDDFTEEGKRAYSTYIEVSYDAALPFGFSLTPTVGMTPWKSCYSYYEGDFAVNNVSLKLNWEKEFGDHFCLDVYMIGMMNTYGINKENAITEISERYDNQRLNGAIGIGLWLY